MDLETLKYPIGKYKKPNEVSDEELQEYIGVITNFPQELAKEAEALTEEDLALNYRPGSWNIKQVIHHCADSHMNAFIRYKLALTEENPTIKPYKEELWAELMDTKKADVKVSLQIIDGLHMRWAILLNSLEPVEFDRTYYHPEKHSEIALWEATALYAWHCKHHLAHIQQAKKWRNNFDTQEPI
ncbi:MAG: YfiT family bacillithiol transferase [Bacteroidia bacterium]